MAKKNNSKRGTTLNRTPFAVNIEAWVVEQKNGKYKKRLASVSEQLCAVKTVLLTKRGKAGFRITLERATLD